MQVEQGEFAGLPEWKDEDSEEGGCQTAELALSWRHVAPPSPLLLPPLVPSFSVACPDKTRCPHPEQPLAWPVGALYSSCLGLDALSLPLTPHPSPHPPL